MTDTQLLDLVDTQLAPGEGFFLQRDDANLWVVRVGNVKALDEAKTPWWPKFRDAVAAAKAGVDLLASALEGPPEDDHYGVMGGVSPRWSVGSSFFATTSSQLQPLSPTVKPNKKLTHPRW